ncbi:MAG: plasmid stabilization protein [Candidatus Methylomirabilota bacterium]|nr:type II toxin-antitoxin system RelE/ParE family toxin [candidate division NC10 bacterium]PWB44276.1 MAG: plasmid stabilization protein [candidate division NC10 bacterium]
MRWEFHPEALEEYRKATLHYAERDPSLATRFVEAVEDAIRRILESPERWRVLDEDVRRCLTHVFPYGILYVIEPEFILIVAVMHCSREPSLWKGRVTVP